MDAYRFLLGDQTMLQVPWWWFDALLGWMFVIGLGMWCLGRQIIRFSFATIGLIQGAICGAAAASAFGQQMPMAGVAAAGALIGAAMGWMFYRPGMAVVMAITLSITAPTVALLWTNTPAPEIRQPVMTGIHDTFENAKAPPIHLDEKGVPTITRGDLDSMGQPLKKMGEQVADNLRSWWADLQAGARWLTIMLAVGGMAVGLTFGMIFPSTAATLVSSLLGVLMMSGGVRRVGQASAQVGSLLPDTTQMLLIWLGAAVVIGTFLQCTLFRRSADK